jgi:hypothetical protein
MVGARIITVVLGSQTGPDWGTNQGESRAWVLDWSTLVGVSLNNSMTSIIQTT